jgi:membrane-bound lytic murein transglycosylase A
MTGLASADPRAALPPLDALAETRPLAFADLPGWAGDDALAAFRAFLETCKPLADGAPAQRLGVKPPESLVAICRKALAEEVTDIPAARAFFEAHFRPFEVQPRNGKGFLTAYFEPEIAASREKTAEFPVPVLGRPADLVTFAPDEPRPPGIDPAFAAARLSEGLHAIYPDRAAIWAGALAGRGLEIAWLRDEAELFITQVQGSARLNLTDGTRARLTYAGRNGHPYTSIGRILVEQGEIPLPEMSLERLMGWLRAEPARGRALMERNASYVFFALEPMLDAAKGPVGGAGVPLATGRSLAVDRTIWPYGLPVWIEVSPLTPAGPRLPLDRLMIAQDTGSAILGPARGDFFMGSGAEAGKRAGLVRDSMRFVVLWPRGM